MSPLKNFAMAVAAIALTTSLIGCGSEDKEITLTAQQEKEVSERLAPEGEVALEGEVGSVVAAPAGGPARSGQEVYDTKCFTCHASGAAGAPKLGVVADWTDRIAQGIETLYTGAISGVRGMPPKGLCMDCSDDELKATVDYMVEGSK